MAAGAPQAEAARSTPTVPDGQSHRTVFPDPNATRKGARCLRSSRVRASGRWPGWLAQATADQNSARFPRHLRVVLRFAYYALRSSITVLLVIASPPCLTRIALPGNGDWS